MTKTRGTPIVLTASRAEANEYDNNPFAAFICTFPHKLSGLYLRDHLEHLPSNPDGTATSTIYGLRKVEALLADAFGPETVAVAHYDMLDRFIGPDTKIVAVSTMDPMGLAYVSTTYNSLIGFGGEALNASEFKLLINHPAIRWYKPKLVVGGAGAWQIAEAGKQHEFGIDVLFQGEAEDDLVPLFKKLLSNDPVPPVVTAKKPDRTHIPLIQHAASYGMVEITRGCGRGCQFCSPTNRTKYSVPLPFIMKEVAVNVNSGSHSIFTVTEDIFLYKSKPNFVPNRPAIVELYNTIARYPGVDNILLSHASLAPVIYDRKLLDELSPILLEKTKWRPETSNLYKKPFVSVEVGIETGSVRLMKQHMKGKALPYTVDNWPQLVLQGVGAMNDYDWWPLCTIMTGQPDETEADVRATLDLIDDLRNHNAKMFYTPVLFIPLQDAVLGNQRRTNLKNLTELQWEVLAKCWRNNIDFWNPDMKWLYHPMFFFSHWFYARWRHGKKSTWPMMHLSGFPLNKRVDRPCVPEYCQNLHPSISSQLFNGFLRRR